MKPEIEYLIKDFPREYPAIFILIIASIIGLLVMIILAIFFVVLSIALAVQKKQLEGKAREAFYEGKERGKIEGIQQEKFSEMMKLTPAKDRFQIYSDSDKINYEYLHPHFFITYSSKNIYYEIVRNGGKSKFVNPENQSFIEKEGLDYPRPSYQIIEDKIFIYNLTDKRLFDIHTPTNTYATFIRTIRDLMKEELQGSNIPLTEPTNPQEKPFIDFPTQFDI